MTRISQSVRVPAPARLRLAWPTFRLAMAAAVVATGLTYAGLIVWFAPTQATGDESSYAALATNLTHGYFSPPGEIHLWWGPGYPLVLAGLMVLHLPPLAERLLNGVFVLGAAVLTYRCVRLYAPPLVAVLPAALVACYPPALQALPFLVTEPLALLLASLWMYLFCLAHRDGISASRRWWLIVGSSVVLAYLAMTKVFFGWVILASVLASAVIAIATREAVYRRWLVASALALALCVPYLAYTYSVTGRPFYWGTSGGLSLYWMATPVTGELGDWFSLSDMRDDARLAPQHRVLFASIDHLNQLQQDDALRAAAVSNIEQHPAKYLLNWLNNIGRLLLNYPYSFTPFKVKSLGIGLLNIPLLALGLWALVRATRSRQPPPPALVVVGLVAIISFVGSSLLSAYVRQFVPLAPMLALVSTVTLWQMARPVLLWRRRNQAASQNQ